MSNKKDRETLNSPMKTNATTSHGTSLPGLDEMDVIETGRVETLTQCKWIFTVLRYTAVLFFVLLIKKLLQFFFTCDFPPSPI